MRLLLLSIFVCLFSLNAISKNCNDAIDKEVTIENSYKYPERSFTSKHFFSESFKRFKKLPDQIRKETLFQLAKYRGNSETVNNFYLKLLNDAISENVLEKSEIDKLLISMKNTNSPSVIEYFKDSKTNMLSIDPGNTKNKLELWKTLVNKSELNFRNRGEWLKLLKSMDVTYQDLNLIVKNIEKLPQASEQNLNILLSFTRQANTKSLGDRIKFYNDIKEVFNPNTKVSSVKKVQKKIKKFDELEAKDYEMLNKNDSEKSIKLTDEIKAKNKSKANDLRRIREKLTYGCRSKTPNAIRANTKKSFKLTLLGANLVSTATFFGVTHKDEFQNKENIPSLVGEAMWEVSTALTIAFFNSRFATRAADTQTSRSFKSYTLKRAVDLVQSPAYAAIFKKNEKKAKEILLQVEEEIKRKEQKSVHTKSSKSSIFTEIIFELLDKMENDEHLKKVRDDFVSYLDENGTSMKMLDDPEGLELLIDAITQKIYWQEMGGIQWMKTGDIALDRLIFNAMYSTPRIPMMIWIATKSYEFICRQKSSAASIATAGLVLALDSFFGNFMYFKLRKLMVGQ